MDNELHLTLSVTDLDGFHVHGYEGDYIFYGIQDTGHYYEEETLKKWTPLFGRVRTLLDIGANLGNHTLYWSKYLQPEKIVAFEPFPENDKVLRLNLEENGLTGTVTAETLAVGASQGYVSVSEIDPGNLGGTAFKLTDLSASSGAYQPARMTSVDLYAGQHNLAVDVMKIDTEGFELAVLKGAEKTLQKDRPALWIEVSGGTHAAVREYLQSLGYRLIDIMHINVLYLHSSKTDLQPLFDMDTLIDMMYRYQQKTYGYYADYKRTKRLLEEERAKARR